MATPITQLAQQAQATTTPDQQLENVILILQDALRRLQQFKT